MIATFTLFDGLNFASPLRRVLPPLLVVLVAAVVPPWPAVGIGAAALVMTLLAPNHFATDERGRLDTLYATLPISRRTVVLGRYAALVLLHLVVAAAATALAVLVSLLRGQEVSADVLVPVNLGSSAFYLLALAVQLPFFFALGYTRARPLAYLPAVVLTAGAWLAGRTGVLDGLDLGGLTAVDPTVLTGAALVVSLVALALSAALSSARYSRRNL